MTVPTGFCSLGLARRLVVTLAFVLLALVPRTAPAAIVNMVTTIDGAQEPTASTGTGGGTFVVDTVANTLSFNITFSGLTTPEMFSHIHGPAPRGVAAGILFTLPNGSPKVGVWNYPEAQEGNILGGLTYVNIHSNMFPGGEIRGQIEQVPNPIPTASEWGLMIFALLLLSAGAWFALRRRPPVAV